LEGSSKHKTAVVDIDYSARREDGGFQTVSSLMKKYGISRRQHFMGALAQKYGESFGQQIVQYAKKAGDHAHNELYTQ